MKLKFLTSKPTSPRKFPVLGSRTALFFDWKRLGEWNIRGTFFSSRMEQAL